MGEINSFKVHNGLKILMDTLQSDQPFGSLFHPIDTIITRDLGNCNGKNIIGSVDVSLVNYHQQNTGDRM